MTDASGVTLSDIEPDALTQRANLGVSRAAANLALMVHEEVILSVSKVVLLTRQEAIHILSERESKNVVAVHQIFEGDISGSELSLEEIIELEQEGLAETGNVILNSCLATIANSLNSSLKISRPEVLRGESDFSCWSPPPPRPARPSCPSTLISRSEGAISTATSR